LVRVTPPKTRRLGRPPASSASETRQRILEVACAHFAEHGYGVATNKEVAATAGITTGALYYYFDSKLDMYLAVFSDLQARVDARFATVTDGETTFKGRMCAILEATYDMNVEDPSIARFFGAARVDRVRYPEVQEAIPYAPGEGFSLMKGLIDFGVATGEIPPDNAKEVSAVLRTLFVGLVNFSQDLVQQRRTIDGIHALVEGRLINPPNDHTPGRPAQRPRPPRQRHRAG
jgi:AcrR family transcriptional regulator